MKTLKKIIIVPIYVIAAVLVYVVNELYFRAKWLFNDLLSISLGFKNYADYMQYMLNLGSSIRNAREALKDANEA